MFDYIVVVLKDERVLKNGNIEAKCNPFDYSHPRLQSILTSILFFSATATSPSLVTFTLNFTITNLHHAESMGFQGSEIFNSTERILNHLVRTLSCSPCVISVWCPLALSSLSLLLTAQAHVQE